MTRRATSGTPCRQRDGSDLAAVTPLGEEREDERLDLAAQVEFESKFKAKFKSELSHFSFKCLVPGGFNMGFIGSTCTASPRGRWGCRCGLARGARARAQGHTLQGFRVQGLGFRV